MNRVINMHLFGIILSAFILLGSSILGFILPYSDGNSLWTIFSVLWLFVEPTKIFFRRKYNKIISNWYYIILLFFEFVILFFMLIYRNEYSLWMIYICLLLLIIISFFSKKEKYICEMNFSRWLYVMIGIIAFATYFSQISMNFFEAPIGIALSTCSFVLALTMNKFSKEQEKIVCTILMLFSIFLKQPVCFLLFIRIFLDFDSF